MFLWKQIFEFFYYWKIFFYNKRKKALGPRLDKKSFTFFTDFRDFLKFKTVQAILASTYSSFNNFEY